MQSLVNKILPIIALVFISASSILAQDKEDISIVKNEIRKYRDSVYIDYSIIIEDLRLESDRYLTLTPVIISSQGQSIELDAILINGQQRQKLYNRIISLGHTETHYRVLNAKECKNRIVIPYKATVAYQNWMLDAKVELTKSLCGCGGKMAQEDKLTIADNIKGIRPIPLPLFSTTYIAPEKVEKKRELSGEAFVIFPVSKYVLIPDLAQNKAELSKINRSIDYVNDVPGVRITNITIEAYASPEGYIQNNITLSENRAAALKKYVKDIYDLREELFISKSKGENWSGLLNALDTLILNSTQKADVRQIIATNDLAERKTRLKAYDKGEVYKYLLANIYPLLRRSEYKIEYTIPVYTLDESKKLLLTRPGILSLDELYQIANSYEKGSDKFKEVFDIAVRLYPNDIIANLNAAAIELDTNNTTKAMKYLEPNLDNNKAYNNIGVMYAQMKELDKALLYFEKAITNGDKVAADNLKKLQEYAKQQ